MSLKPFIEYTRNLVHNKKQWHGECGNQSNSIEEANLIVKWREQTPIQKSPALLALSPSR